MIAVLFSVMLVFVILAMSTLGGVLLVTFFMRSAAFGARVLVSALAGPATLFVPVTMFTAFKSAPDLIEVFVGFGVVGGVACVLVGWPVAHGATKALDKLIQFDMETFE